MIAIAIRSLSGRHRMSKVVILLIMVLLATNSVVRAQNCSLSNTPAWSPVLRNVIGECDNRYPSPNQRFVMEIRADGALRLIIKSHSRELKLPVRSVDPPAMISWSPRSNEFFINDGEGSGMSSSFRMFRLNSEGAIEDDSIEHTAVVVYRKLKRCSPSAANPNVWGFGWSSDGRQIFLLIQATVNQPCGRPDSFVSLIVNAVNGSVQDKLTAIQTKQRFKTLLPQELFSK
jgi:hypothetical protein